MSAQGTHSQRMSVPEAPNRRFLQELTVGHARSSRIAAGSDSASSATLVRRGLAPGSDIGHGRSRKASVAGLLRLDRQDLVETTLVARLAAERRCQERQRAFERRFRADDPGAQRQHVHIVVLDALMRGIRVVANRRSDAAHLVGRDARPDPRPADRGSRGQLRRAGSPRRAGARSRGSRRSGRSHRPPDRCTRGSRPCAPIRSISASLSQAPA